jgi:hypothetical protein
VAGWSERNARARAAGYESYYDYRAHDYGRLPPSAPRVSGDELARLRGHRGAADFARLVESGRAELVNVNTSKRDARGRIIEVQLLVTDSDGRTREYVLRGARAITSNVRRLRRVVSDAADTMLVVGSPGAMKAMGLA